MVGNDINEPDGQSSELRKPVPDEAPFAVKECWRLAREAFYTAYMFERRARQINRNLRLITFAGLLVPLVIGGLALSYGAGFDALPLLIIIGSAVGLVQVTYSLWSIVATWVESYAYSIESVISNKSIYNRAKKLAQDETLDVAVRRNQLELLEVEDNNRRDQDYKQGLSEKERRRAMRATLVQFNKECAGCKKTPTDMTNTKCGVCGDFDSWWRKW